MKVQFWLLLIADAILWLLVVMPYRLISRLLYVVSIALVSIGVAFVGFWLIVLYIFKPSGE